MKSEGELVVLRRYPHRIHAELAKSALEAYGLTVVLDVGSYGRAHETSEMDLLVRAEDAEQALEILGPEETFSS
jgi:predicted nucleotidyltransferase